MKLLPIPLPPLGAPPPLGLWNSEMMWRYPAAPSSPLNDIKTQMPPQLATDPRLWNRDDVAVFLRWCEREFDLPTFEMELFQMNGKAMCLLTKTDLAERIPGAGDLLHNVIQMLVRESQLIHRHLPNSPVTPTSRYPLSPHSHPATPNWSALAPPDSPFHSPAHLQHFMQTNSVTLSPAPSVDSQASSPPRQPDTVQNVFPKTESSSSNPSDSDEDSYQDANNAKVSSQNSPPLTPITKEAPNIPQQLPNVVNSWACDKSSPATPLTPGAFLPVKREFFPDTPEPNTNGRLLWDFLQQLLNDPAQRYSNYIAWKCRDTGVFKIVDPAGLAKLWGIQKNHLSMNYDKMSRALRYYYRVNILRKVQGERHCYQFLRNPTELKNIKNISLLRQSTPASPSAIPSNTQSSQQQQQTTQQHHQQSQQTNSLVPPNSPMMVLANSIHHHHISTNGVPSPAMTNQQQFNFPPHPSLPVSPLSQSSLKTHHQQAQLLSQQQPHIHHPHHQQHLMISNFKVEPKTDHDDMPTDLSLSSNDRRYVNGNGVSSEAYPLIRNSNGLTTITLVQNNDRLSPSSTSSHAQNDPHQSTLSNDSKNIMDSDTVMLPTDLRKQE